MMDEYQKRMPQSMVRTMEQFNKCNRWSALSNHRWITWAKSLIDRYNQTTSSYRTLPMIFIHPLMVDRLLDERLSVTLQRLYPRINLVFLQNVSNTDKKYHLLNHQSHNEFLTKKSVLNRFNTFLYHHDKRKREQNYQNKTLYEKNFLYNITRSQKYPVLINHHQIIPAQKADVTYDAVQYSPSSEGDKTAPSSLVIQDLPLKKVFKRLRQRQDVFFTDQYRKIVIEDAEGITKRVIQKTQRVEEHITKVPTFVSRQPQVSVPQTSSSGIKQQVIQPDSPVLKKAPMGLEMQNAQAIPAMTIDNLTDQVIRQIDRRIIARRERMGKI